MSPLTQFLHRRERRDGGAAAHPHISLSVRSSVLWHQLELDRELAAGADPEGSVQRSVRARQLLGAHVCHELAGCIDSALARCEHPPHWHSAALPIQAAAVKAARPELERLREVLLAERPALKSIALASLLLHDEHSPVYVAGGELTIAALARAATTATDPAHPESAG